MTYIRNPSREFETIQIRSSVAARCLSVLAIAIAAPTAHAQDKIPFPAARMIIEYNASARDIGVQFFLDAEEWRYVKIIDPDGNVVFDASAKGRLLTQGGGTELFLESVEPELGGDTTLTDFFETFPGGMYRFRGTTPEGDQLWGNVRFTHVIPAGPEITLPVPVEDGCTANVPIPAVIAWNDVTTTIKGQPLEVDRYEVIVETDNEDANFDVHLPVGSATSVTVPSEFLEPGRDYVFEVLAVEAGGNQTSARVASRPAGIDPRRAGYVQRRLAHYRAASRCLNPPTTLA